MAKNLGVCGTFVPMHGAASEDTGSVVGKVFGLVATVAGSAVVISPFYKGGKAVTDAFGRAAVKGLKKLGEEVSDA